jgi:hypothetical protein
MNIQPNNKKANKNSFIFKLFLFASQAERLTHFSISAGVQRLAFSI